MQKKVFWEGTNISCKHSIVLLPATST